MADTGLIKHKCMTLCVENCDRVPTSNQCRCQFTASAIGIEKQRKFPTVNVLDLHLQTKERGEIHNLTQEAPMASRSVSNHVATLVEVQINVSLVWEVNEAGEDRAAPKIRPLSRVF